jgi:acetyl-CoA carboxylase alpha subunit
MNCSGDRAFADDPAIVGGLAKLDGLPVMVIGHQKGRDTKDKISPQLRHAAPEGYRKALRLMKLAERFKLSDPLPDRHARRLPWHQRGGARAERGDRP